METWIPMGFAVGIFIQRTTILYYNLQQVKSLEMHFQLHLLVRL